MSDDCHTLEIRHSTVSPIGPRRARWLFQRGEKPGVSKVAWFEHCQAWPVRLEYAQEWLNSSAGQAEAQLVGTFGDMKIGFYDFAYSQNKRRYDPSRPMLFKISLVAYRLELISGLDADWEDDARFFVGMPPSLGGCADEIQGSTTIDRVSAAVIDGMRFQICDVVLAETCGTQMVTQLLVPASIYPKALRAGDQIAYSGWLCGHLI